MRKDDVIPRPEPALEHQYRLDIVERHPARVYLDAVFLMVDCLLNALRGGIAGQTLSMAAALAEKVPERWGCVLCAWLSISVQKDHCRRTLEGKPMSTRGEIMAAIQLALVFAVVFYGPLYLVWRFL